MDDALRTRIRSARSLPSLPATTVRLIQLCEDPGASVRDVIDVIGSDPALAARLMRLANSPLYARRRRTEDLRQAVTLLGFDVVLTASLSLVIAADRRVKENRSPAFRARRWTRSVQAAAGAQLIAERVPRLHVADAFLAALLQDIGVQVIDRLEPDTYVVSDPDGTHDDLVAAERAALDADHAEIGAELLDAWRLPDEIVDAVRWSHEPMSESASTLAKVVGVGGLIADGIAGESEGFERAGAVFETSLGLGSDDFTDIVSSLVGILPDFAAVLDAEVPDPEMLSEIAEDAILARQTQVHSAATELRSEVEELTAVATELRTQNEIDALTGLASSCKLDEVMAHEFSVATRHGQPLSLLFVDLDDFKMVNDRYGHAIGDALLVQAARRVSSTVRNGDVVGRFGGEEFVVVLPGADRRHADEAAERVISRFREFDFALGSGTVLAQTVSVGVVTVGPKDFVRDVDELVNVADLALYAAKRKGKDQWRRGEVPAAPAS